MSKILIMGTGAFGTALANILLINNHQVSMYGVDDLEIQDLKNQKNSKYFGEKKLYSKLEKVTNNFEEAIKEIEYLVIAIPSKFVRSTLNQFKHLIDKKVTIIVSSKGLDQATGNTFLDVVREIIPHNEVCSIAGPTFASELYNCVFSTSNIVSRNLETADEVVALFNNNFFKLDSSIDEIGSSVFSAMKNGLAIGCGMLFQLNCSINTVASFITKGIQEINDYVLMKNGLNSTILQYSAIGDVFLTCSCDKSRNYKFGREIVLHGIEDALKNNKVTVEGVTVIENIYPFIKDKENFQVFKTLYKLIKNEISYLDFISHLWKEI